MPVIRRFGIVLLLVSLALPAAGGVGIWTPLGPDGGEVLSLAADPSDPETAYAETWGGIFRTEDGGQSWTRIPREWAHLLGLADGTLYAWFLTDLDNAKSEDGGRTWIPVPTLPRDVFRVIGDPRKPNRVWAVGRTVYRSDDGGATWQALKVPGLNQQFLADLAVDPAGSWAYALLTNSFYRSADLGKTWKRGRLPAQGRLRRLAVDPGNPAVLYAVSETALFRSLDRGARWQRIGANALKGTLQDVVAAGNRVHVSVLGAGIFSSSDQGATWTRGLGSPAAPGRMAAAAGVLYAGSQAIGEPGGVYRSLDRGAMWERASAGLHAQAVSAIAVDPTDSDVLYAGTSRGGLLRSADRGATWETVDLAVPPRRAFGVSRIFSDPTAVYVLGTAQGLANLHFRSDDGGGTWQLLQDARGLSSIVPDLRQPGALWGSWRGVFHSDDRGEHWTPVGPPELSELFLYTVRVDPRDPRIVYTAGHTPASGGGDPEHVHPRLYRSADGGATWQRRDAGITADAIMDLALDPAAPDTLYAATEAGLFRSPDAGQTWVRGGIDDWVEQVVAAPITPTTLYAVTDRLGVLRSTDGGKTWAPTTEGPERLRLHNLTVDPRDPNRLYATVSERGVFTYEAPRP